ncbi:hypothetical protein Syun_002806 [Stephania yunnanensis]|uniref:DUF642 domain-containing protein n=1 Tax=Stephania yunnanensis TaxID=152371 RepID=A0AAP0Q108_9MAGN
MDQTTCLDGQLRAQWSMSQQGLNMDLPSNTVGHAVKLGFDGKINQTFMVDHNDDDKERMQYVLTFTLASTDVRNCLTMTSVIVVVPDRSTLIHLEGVYGKERWESHGTYLGSWGGGEGVNLVMQSQLIETDPNGTCGPVVDAFLLNILIP